MAFAGALAAVILLAQFTEVLTGRTTRYLRRIASMNQTVQQLKRRITAVERRNAAVAERASTDDVLKRIVSAPDLGTIKLSEPEPEKRSSRRPPSGTLVYSPSQHSAILQVARVEPSGKDMVYRVWWQEKRKPEILAAEFTPDSDGKATVPIQLPPIGATMVTVTREAGTDAPRPSGALVLKGRITPVQSQ
jgi:hypothetical protein